MSNFLPVYNLNVPFGGIQQPVTISPTTTVYSTYTGLPVWTGPVPKGITCDAPKGHPNYGKPFHVIEFNPVNKTYMMHRPGVYSKK